MFNRLTRQQVIDLSRGWKQAIAIASDVSGLTIAIFLAHLLRREEIYLPGTVREWFFAWLMPVALGFSLYVSLGLYKSLVRFMSLRGLWIMAGGATLSAAAHMTAMFAVKGACPLSVPALVAMIGMVAVSGSRGAFRLWLTHGQRVDKEKVIVFGVGPGGISLVSALEHGSQFLPVALVDENPHRQNTFIHGLYVYSPRELRRLVDEFEVSRVFLSMDEMTREERLDIIERLESIAVRVQTVPSMADVIAGRARILDIRDIDLEDLLGRDQIMPDPKLMTRCIAGKVVMVTGAGGSIGSELCRQIIPLRPATLVLFDCSEFALYQIDTELRRLLADNSPDMSIIPLIGNVQEGTRLETVMRTWGVQTVYHAAAYKHVPLVEHNMVEGVRNNVMGTWQAAEAAGRAGVETFVLISTDKAVRPTNIMGASKRTAELVLQGLAARNVRTRFCMVRFGNVLGSSGSVVPLFRDQILAGGPVTVTHADVIRYFMTIPEAAQLVIQAGSMGQGGDVFLLDMGEPVRIADLARRMIHLMGHSVKEGDDTDGDIEIVYTGLRPGEKLFEELLIGEDPEGTAHPRILRANEASLPWPEVDQLLRELDRACQNYDCDRIRELLKSAPTGYRPLGAIEDLAWQLHREAHKTSGNVRKLPDGALPRGLAQR